MIEKRSVYKGVPTKNGIRMMLLPDVFVINEGMFWRIHSLLNTFMWLGLVLWPLNWVVWTWRQYSLGTGGWIHLVPVDEWVSLGGWFALFCCGVLAMHLMAKYVESNLKHRLIS